MRFSSTINTVLHIQRPIYQNVVFSKHFISTKQINIKIIQQVNFLNVRYIPSKYFDNVFSVTIFRLPRGLQDKLRILLERQEIVALETSSRRLQDMSSRRFQDMSSRLVPDTVCYEVFF